MTRGLLRRGALPRIDRRAPRVRVRVRARTYVHPLWHAESQLRGHRVRPLRPVSRSSAPRDVPNATTNACRSTTNACRLTHLAERFPTRFEAGHARARALGAEARFATDRRDRDRTLRRRDDDVGSVSERERCGAAQRRTRPNSLLGNHINRRKRQNSERETEVSTPCLLCKKEFSSSSNRRAVNSGERLSCASLIARTVTVEQHGGTHADAQRADDCTCGGSSRRAARFVAEPRGHAPRSNARRGASCQIFFVSVAAICAFRG